MQKKNKKMKFNRRTQTLISKKKKKFPMKRERPNLETIWLKESLVTQSLCIKKIII